MRKFVVFAPSYDERHGGIICLHKLVHQINEAGHEAYLCPTFENLEFNRHNFLMPVRRLLGDIATGLFKPYRTHRSFNTPIYGGPARDLQSDEWVVVYPELVFGNPLKARNVARWLLHQPGFHSGVVYYGFNELHVRFNEALREFRYPNSQQAAFFLPIIHYPLDLYNEEGAAARRSGTAYCIRKGGGKAMQHDLSNSALIDGLSHEGVAAVFKRVETFISYDTYTAYSRFAALCGCDSVVIPDEGVTEAQWYPNPADRYGVAYGFDQIGKARQTRQLLQQKIQQEHQQSAEAAVRFVQACEAFFDRPRYNLFRVSSAR